MTDTAQPRPLGMRDVLGYADARKLVFAQAISDIGDGLTLTALLLLVNSLTGSTAALAAISIVLAVPPITVGLFAGAIADRHDRRRIMLIADTLRALLVASFVIVATLERLPILYVLAFVQAVIGTFFNPARSALIPRTVPEEALMAANALNQMSRIVFGVVGTMLAGLIVGLTGQVWPAFLLDAATFLASVAIVSRVTPSLGRVEPVPSGSRGSLTGSVGEGLGIIAHNRQLLAALVGISIALLGLGAINVLFLPLVVTVLGASPAWLGPIELAQMSAMVLAGGTVAWLAARLGAPRMVTLGMAGVAGCVGALAAVTGVWQIIVILFIVGWFVMPLQAATVTIAQTASGDAVRGRVMSALQASMSAAQVVSMALAGIFADIVGIRNVFVLGAAACLVGAVVAELLFRSSGSPAAARAGGHAPSEPAPAVSPVLDA